MRFQRLLIRNLRCFTDVDIRLQPGLNLFLGDNGAGKTSLLEAAFLLSHARSFRMGVKDALLQRGAERLQLFAELSSQRGEHRLGLGRENGHWQARLNGEPASVGGLVGLCAVICFAPGSQSLIAGGSEERRRFLDWGLFHVEPAFLEIWRRFQRALKQRNALLRAHASGNDRLYGPWENELAETGIQIDAWRSAYLHALEPYLKTVLAELLPELGTMELKYQRGWPQQAELLEELFAGRERDRYRGHTRYGPHRADWQLSFTHAPGREYLSRGQEKLGILALSLAQCCLFRQQRDEWPIFCIDDLASELDEAHQQLLWVQLRRHEIQVLATGISTFQQTGQAAAVFHVERNVVRSLL